MVLAEIVYIAKLTNKYILLKYNCTGKFFFVAVVVYTYISSYTTEVRRITIKYSISLQYILENVVSASTSFPVVPRIGKGSLRVPPPPQLNCYPQEKFKRNFSAGEHEAHRLVWTKILMLFFLS